MTVYEYSENLLLSSIASGISDLSNRYISFTKARKCLQCGRANTILGQSFNDDCCGVSPTVTAVPSSNLLAKVSL